MLFVQATTHCVAIELCHAATHNASLKEAFDEVVELLNDEIDLLKPFLGDRESIYKLAFKFAVTHLVMLLGYGIFNDLLLGNLPAHFMLLRTMTEALVKAYYVDMAETRFFETNLKLFEDNLKEKGSARLRCLGGWKRSSLKPLRGP